MFGIIRVPRNFSATVGWMLLWWSLLRLLFLFCIYSWISLLKAAINNIAPFMHYIYSLFIANKGDKSDNIDILITKLQKLLSFCMFFMALDGIFHVLLIYGSNKKSYMWMLPWIVYSFMSLIILTITPIDFYYRTQVNTTSVEHVDAGFGGVLEKFSTYFIYLTIQLLLLIAVFENFQSLRVNKTYFYLKQAIGIEKDMVITMLDLYEKSILKRFAATMSKKVSLPSQRENTDEVIAVDVDAECAMEPTENEYPTKSSQRTTKF